MVVNSKNVFDTINYLCYTPGMGRPSSPEAMTRRQISLPDAVWARVVDYRFAERIPSEAEAVRRLIQAGLDAEEKARRKAKRGAD